MKRLIYILLAVSAMVAAFSCSDNKEEVAAESFSVISADLSYSPAGGNGQIVVNSSEGITATSSRDEWCHVSVNGETISVTVDPQTSMESRYSYITIKKGDSKVAVTVQQMGNFISGEFPSSFNLNYEAFETSYEYKANGDIVITTSEDWITATVENGTMKFAFTENTEHMTRRGTITYSLGDYTGTFDVLQYPKFVVHDGWSLSYDGDQTVSSKTYSILTNTVSEPVGKFVIDYIDEDSYVRLARSHKEIAEGLMAPFYQEYFKSYIETGNTDWYEELSGEETSSTPASELSMGKYYVYAVGFNDDGYPNGYYSVAEINVPMKPYDRWIGKWDIIGHLLDEDETQDRKLYTVEITANVKGTSYYMTGWPGPNVKIPLLFNSNGTLNIIGNRNSSNADQGRIASNVTFSGTTYAGIYAVGRALKATNTWTYFTGNNYTMATGTLTDAGFTTATVTPRSGTTSGTAYTYKLLQLAGVKSGSTSVTFLKPEEIAVFPFTMKKKD